MNTLNQYKCFFFRNKKKLVIPFTKEQGLEISLKYETRVAFQKNDGGAYQKALRDGFLDEACTHMSTAQKFRTDLPTTFYLLKINSSQHGEFVGYGITNDWDDRYRDHKSSLSISGMTIVDIKTFECKNGIEAKNIEDKFKSKFEKLNVDVRGFKRENFHNKHYAVALNYLEQNKK